MNRHTTQGSTMKQLLAVIALLLPLAASAELPADSLYHSETHWQSETGQPVKLTEFAGKTQVVAFVYTHCISMCPLIVTDLKKIEKSLARAELNNTEFLLISLDPEKDTPDTKRAFMKEHKLAHNKWHFLSGSEADTRELALLFNVRYRNEGNEIIHSNTISLLDAQGRLVYQRNGNEDLSKLTAALKNTALSKN